MKLEGYRRLEAHVPTDLWDEIEKARGQMTRSEFTRQALRAQLDYPSMVAAPEGGVAWKKGAKGMVELSTVKPGRTARAVSDEMKEGAAKVVYPEAVLPVKTAKTTASDALKTPAMKTAREILLERTRLMRGNNA